MTNPTWGKVYQQHRKQTAYIKQQHNTGRDVRQSQSLDQTFFQVMPGLSI